MTFAALLSPRPASGSCGGKREEPQKQVPEAGAASTRDNHCSHNVTVVTVYAAQLRIFISQFDGFPDPSHFVMKLELLDSDFLGAYVMSPVVAKALRQGLMPYYPRDTSLQPGSMRVRGGCCCPEQNFRTWVILRVTWVSLDWRGPSAQSLTLNFNSSMKLGSTTTRPWAQVEKIPMSLFC